MTIRDVIRVLRPTVTTLLLAGLLLGTLASTAVAAPDAAKPGEGEPPAAAPRKIAVIVLLDKLTKFEVGPGTFQADIDVLFRCEKAPCDPSPIASNGKFTIVEAEKLSPEVKLMKLKAELDAQIDLSEFPFDKHTLPIGIEDKNPDVEYYYDEAFANLAMQEAGLTTLMNPEVKLAGWNIGKTLDAVVVKHKFGGNEIDNLAFQITLSRPLLASFFKTLMPVFFMIFVAAFTLILKPKSAGARLGTATSGLIAVVMFHLNATSSLPPLGYLTRMDKFMIATYAVYLLNIALSVAIVRFDEKKDEKNAELTYSIAAGAVPGLAFLAWLNVFLRVV